MDAAKQAFPDPHLAELAQAAAAGDAAQVRALASTGIDLNAKGDRDVTLLQFALLSKSAAGMQALLDAGADPSTPGLDGDTVLHTAAMVNDPRYLTLLLDNGADPNARNARTQAPVIFAALRGNNDALFRALLDAGADPAATDRHDNTALHQAGKYGQADNVLTLLAAGTPPAARNRQGATFQAYLFVTNEAILTAEARRDRDRVREWLIANQHPVETP